MDIRGAYSVADDGDRFHGLCLAMGTDELLGRYGDYQPVLGYSVDW